jgi:hypothetical protein
MMWTRKSSTLSRLSFYYWHATKQNNKWRWP